MIPEREREALMRLTMCAREECRICMYKMRCDYNFQYELATKNMNILADALRVDRKTEPSGYCNECKWYGDKQVCGRCRSRNLYAPKDEPSGYNLSPVEDEPQTDAETKWLKNEGEF